MTQKPYTFAISGPTAPPYGELADSHYESTFGYVDLQFGRPSRIFSGCAFGVDTDFLKGADEIWPEVPITCVVPAAPHNVAFIIAMGARDGTEIIRLPSLYNQSDSYMDRNDKLAELADKLVAFPMNSREVLRSGTWATIRRFRKRDKPVMICPFPIGMT